MPQVSSADLVSFLLPFPQQQVSPSVFLKKLKFLEKEISQVHI